MHFITITVCLSIFSYNLNIAQGISVKTFDEKSNSFRIISGQLVDIIQTAINNGNFQSLIDSLDAAGLTSTLKGAGPFTVFAPNDAAAAKIPEDFGQEIIKPENKDKLARLLKYHVINGRAITSSQISGITLPIKQEMLDGGQITVSRDGNKLKINNATVVLADVMATNGVIHVIDEVLIPPDMDFATYFLKNESP